MSDCQLASGSASYGRFSGAFAFVDHVANTAGCKIYCGDEIERAIERSHLSGRLRSSDNTTRFDRISHTINDVRNADFRELVPRACLVTGTERDSGSKLTIGFHGTQRIVDFCSRHLLGNPTFDCARVSSAETAGADILVSDHVFANPLRRAKAGIRVPTWVRQQMPISGDWSSTLSRLPRGLLQEVRRHLRRHRYRAGLSSGRDAVLTYYRDLHVPYITQRFGNDAVLASEDAFVDQCRHMTRLDLLFNDTIVAASLLERRDSRLMIRASSMALSAASFRGRADTLDYFSLLIGQLLACDYLDFGLSRPHLDNGIFRYKSKWCTQLSATGGIKADIRILPQKDNEATRSFLRRNYFLQSDGARFVIRVLGNAREPDDRILQRGLSAGISAVYFTEDPAEAGMVTG